MCGIVGLFAGRGLPADASDVVRAMADCLVHRGPDDAGVWANDAHTVALGHRRLAIIDLSPRGRQPMTTLDGRFSIVFNGEIYNFRELRAELEALGTTFFSHSDTEVLLQGYAQWGENVLEKIVGMFAFAIWDGAKKQLFLARDRTGEKPLYYRQHGAEPFAFASEISALECLPDRPLNIDRGAVSLYLSFRCIPAPYSIYREIKKLPPAHAMRVTADGRLHVWRYWDPVPFSHGPRLAISVPEAIDQTERLLREAVRGQMISDVPLGAFLSGGIDSTAVVAMMRQISPDVHTYTVGFDVPEFDESRHAAAVAKHLGTHHTLEIIRESDVLAVVPRMVQIFGEPFADSSALATHLVCRMARQHVTVCLSGDGGDETFGEYLTYDRFDALSPFLRTCRPVAPLMRLFVKYLPFVPRRIRDGVLPLIGLPMSAVYRYLMAMILPTDAAKMTGEDPPLPQFERAWRSTTGHYPNAALRRLAMLSDTLTYLPESVLPKVDRSAMSVSLETRAPLLDHRVMEFGLQLPVSFVLRKRLLRFLVHRYVPAALVDRRKQGFSVPLRAWLRGPLGDALRDVVTPATMEAAGIVNFGPIRTLLADHFTGRRDHAYRLWTLLVLGLWTHRDRPRYEPRSRQTRYVHPRTQAF